MIYKLVIGSKAYSSWSQRAWLAMRHFDIPFEEILISYALGGDEWRKQARRYSPAARVPILIDGDLTVWDSLAIFEYLHEKHPEKRMWPENISTRARARSISAEIHSGLEEFKDFYPTNYRRQPKPRAAPSAAVNAAKERISDIWKDMLARHGGPYLCGKAFTIADAMYSAVVNRFYAYDLSDDLIVQGYITALRALPAWKEWEKGAAGEAFHLAAIDELD